MDIGNHKSRKCIFRNDKSWFPHHPLHKYCSEYSGNKIWKQTRHHAVRARSARKIRAETCMSKLSRVPCETCLLTNFA